MEDDEPLSKVEANALAHRQLHLNKKQQTQKSKKKKKWKLLRNLRYNYSHNAVQHNLHNLIKLRVLYS